MSERVTHLHIPVPAITHGTLARTHELTKRRNFFDDDARCIMQNLTLMYCLSTYVLEKCLLMPLFSLYVPKYN